MHEPAACGARPAQQSNWQAAAAEAEFSGSATATRAHRISAARIVLAENRLMKCRAPLCMLQAS